MTMDNQSGPKVEDKLEDALAMLAAGIPLEEVLTEAGDDAGWLRPLLELADEVGEFQQTVSIPGPEASLQRMLSHAEKLAATGPGELSAQSGWSYLLSNIFGGGLRLAAGLATALLIFVLAGGTFTLAAQRSLPGEPLYPLKRAGERLQLNLARDPDQREQLLDTFNQRRQMEVSRLLAEEQEGEVTLQGEVVTVTADSIELAGLAARLTPDTQIEGSLAAGSRVRAEIKVYPPDKVVALSLTVIESPVVLPSPTPTPTMTSPSMATPGQGQAADTLPVLEPTATPVRSQEVDTLPTPSPTATPRPMPTEDADFEDGPADNDSTGAANENDNGEASPPEDDDNFDDNDNFDEDENDTPVDDGDRGNDNSGDDDNPNENGDDDSGSNDNSDDSGRDDNSDDDDSDDDSDDDDKDDDDNDDD